jgi:hypothetical protein
MADVASEAISNVELLLITGSLGADTSSAEDLRDV